MATQAKLLSFTFPTSTGNLAVTGVGFQPQFVRFWHNQIDGTGTTTGTGAGNGMMHAGGQGATYVTNAADGVEGRQRVTSSNCITVVNTSGTVIAAATYVSFGADGFTINVTTAPAAAFTVDVLCLRGDDLAIQSGIITSSSSPVTVSLAAQADLLWLFGNAQSNFTGNQGSVYEGVALSTSNRLTTGSVRRRQADGSGASSGIDTDYIWRAAVEGTSTWDLTTFSSSEFVLTRSSGSGNIFAIWVALRGIDVALGTLTQPSATGTQTISAGLQPAAVVLLGGDTDSDGTYPTTGAEYVRGASDGSAQFAHWYGIISGSSPTPQGGRARSTSKMLTSYSQGTPTLNADAAIDALLSDGFRLNWTTADATARVLGWLAFGNPAPNPITIAATLPGLQAAATVTSGHTTATLAATLPPLTGAVQVQAGAIGAAIAAPLPGLQAAATVTSGRTTATLAATLPGLQAAITSTGRTRASIASTLPGLQTAATVTSGRTTATLAATLPGLSGAVSATAGVTTAQIAAVLPALSGSASVAAGATTAQVAAILPNLGAAVTLRSVGNPIAIAATLPALSAAIRLRPTGDAIRVQATLPALSGAVSVTSGRTRAAIAATLPALTGHIQTPAPDTAVRIAATLPALQAAVRVQSGVAHISVGTVLPHLGASLRVGAADGGVTIAGVLPGLQAAVQVRTVVRARVVGVLPLLGGSITVLLVTEDRPIPLPLPPVSGALVGRPPTPHLRAAPAASELPLPRRNP